MSTLRVLNRDNRMFADPSKSTHFSTALPSRQAAPPLSIGNWQSAMTPTPPSPEMGHSGAQWGKFRLAAPFSTLHFLLFYSLAQRLITCLK